jgi:hypothetical protein
VDPSEFHFLSFKGTGATLYAVHIAHLMKACHSKLSVSLGVSHISAHSPCGKRSWSGEAYIMVQEGAEILFMIDRDAG